MATTMTTPKTDPKPKKAPVPIVERVRDQLTRGVLSKKLSHDDLIGISEHVTKLLTLV